MLHAALILTLCCQETPLPADAAQAEALVLPQLEIAQMEAWREHVRPQGSELAYEEIPWLSEFSEGLQASSDEGKPLLFWAMNGHPLGTT